MYRCETVNTLTNHRAVWDKVDRREYTESTAKVHLAALVADIGCEGVLALLADYVRLYEADCARRLADALR